MHDAAGIVTGQDEARPVAYPRQAGKPVKHPAFVLNLGWIGAGEGIRTLDPNLGKVVLYP